MTAIERAFELARSGRFSTASEIRTAVSHEGYSPDQITGRTLLAQLRDLIKRSRTAA